MNSIRSAASEPTSPLLRLPLELRQEIFLYVLPHTAPAKALVDTHSQAWVLVWRRESESEPFSSFVTPSITYHDNTVWHRGCTAILAVNRQISEECLTILYGRNTFAIYISFNHIDFKYRWLVNPRSVPDTGGGIKPRTLTPTRDFSFLDHLSQVNIQRIRKYRIHVEHPDSYMGMVKYNCGGRGLTVRLKEQVGRLVEVMRCTEGLHEVTVHLTDCNYTGRKGRLYPGDSGGMNAMLVQTVLDPLRSLRRVRRIHISGAVQKDFADKLEYDMSDDMGTSKLAVQAQEKFP